MSSGMDMRNFTGEPVSPDPTSTEPKRGTRINDRCSLCGASRIPLNREKTKFGVCTFIECKNPMYDLDREREVESAPAQPAFSQNYKDRYGDPISDACGEGRHTECTQDVTKCHCTFRGGHITPHAYMNFPAVPPAAPAQQTITLSQGGPTMPSGLAWLEGNKTEPLLSSPQAESIPPAAETACPHHMTGPMNTGAPLFPHECGKPLRGVPTGRETAMTAEQLAQLFHETYERLAPQFGYATRKASAKPWADVPDRNKALMTAVCAELAAHVREAAQRVTCGGNVASVGGCRKDISLLEAYRCSDCELYFHRDCLRDHCETSSYVTAIRANKELIEGWKKEVKQSQASAETAERKLAEVEKALQAELEWLDRSEWPSHIFALSNATKFMRAALASLRAESKEG